jgi:hypothetical protein
LREFDMDRRLILAVALGVVGGAAQPARADDRARALAVVERAIKAHGGADALSRAQVASRGGKGVFAFGREVPFQTEVTLNLPHQTRLSIEANGQQLLFVLNGDKGWHTAGGLTVELTKQRVAELQEEAYVWWLETLVPLRGDGFDLAPLPDVKVNDRPAAALKVSSKGHADVTLFFDKESGLLVKAYHRALDAGAPVDKEYLLSDPKDVGGAKLASKEAMYIKGVKMTEVTYTSYKFLPKPDEAAFARP